MQPDLLKLDVTARQQALDVQRSFLMQAPAGSGKTEVLTQRFLALLAVVRYPEHILALTFTKKAAAEMRYRLLNALHLAQKPAPSIEPDLSRWQLAQAVLKRDQEQGWQLLSSPHRLRLYTIDSLCATLVKQSPLAVPFAGHRILSDAQLVYREAIETILNAQQVHWSDALVRVLAYFNTDYGYFQRLLEGLLATRQRWRADAQVIASGVQENRFTAKAVMALFQQQLEDLQAYFIAKICDFFISYGDWDEFWQLLVYASENYASVNIGAHSGSGDILPPALQPCALTLVQWQIVVRLILTGQGEIRRRLDKRSGFPATDKAKKQRMIVLLHDLSASPEWVDVRQYLKLISKAPVHYMQDAQHPLAIDLFIVADAGVQVLEQLFTQQKTVDYVGLAQSALASLGDKDLSPSDLLLRFDYQIQHILMDEFQDTSNAQMQLFERLVSGWQVGDGRSLFFVGDPMQSIYGFRDADVNLFYEIQKHGLADIPLEFLQLRRNFRTQPQLVHILQTLLAPLFPATEDPVLHQVTFSQAVPAKETNTVEQPLVACLFETAQAEADWVVASVAALLQDTDDLEDAGSIAIVVRKKKHVPLITQRLRQARILYTAVELDPLWFFTSVRDLFHLVAVVCDTAQLYHFCAVCRSPWIGLGLLELEALAQYWRLDPGLQQFANGCRGSIAGLSQDAHHRVRFLLQGVRYFQQDSSLTLVEQVRGLWMSLLGPEIVPQDELQPVADFWKVLGSLVLDGRVSLESLQLQLEKANTSVVDVNARVEIMTIHKAKGLEFNTVFVPCLHDLKSKGNRGLLEIVHFQLSSAVSSSIVSHTLFGVHQSSDIREKKQENDACSVAQFLKAIQQRREHNELSRLFYVAATRAEQQLYLSGVIAANSRGEYKAADDSLLAQLMPYFEQQQVDVELVADMIEAQSPLMQICQETVDEAARGCAFQPVDRMYTVNPSQRGDYWPIAVRKSMQGFVGQQVGQLIHLWLSKISIAVLDQSLDWTVWFENMITTFQWHLKDRSEERSQNKSSVVEQCVRLVHCMEQDAILRWLLLARKTVLKEMSWQYDIGQVQTLRPDLAFYDDETSTLWVVDFKITHEVHHTLASVKSAYGAQLQAYGVLFQKQGFSAIELAVYQPQVNNIGWWHWPM